MLVSTKVLYMLMAGLLKYELFLCFYIIKLLILPWHTIVVDFDVGVGIASCQPAVAQICTELLLNTNPSRGCSNLT